MNRRRFLLGTSGILATATAPAIVRADSLMRTTPLELTVLRLTGQRFPHAVVASCLAKNPGDLLWKRYVAHIEPGASVEIPIGTNTYCHEAMACLDVADVQATVMASKWFKTPAAGDGRQNLKGDSHGKENQGQEIRSRQVLIG